MSDAERKLMIDAEVFLSKQPFAPSRVSIDAAGVWSIREMTPAEIEARARNAATRRIDEYLSRRALPWHPGMQWLPTPPRFVSFPVIWRANKSTNGNGCVGGCEDCHERTQRVFHHLHYLSLGREVPSDFAYLCRDCHHVRHGTFGGGRWHLDRTPAAVAAAERATCGMLTPRAAP